MVFTGITTISEAIFAIFAGFGPIVIGIAGGGHGDEGKDNNSLQK